MPDRLSAMSSGGNRLVVRVSGYAALVRHMGMGWSFVDGPFRIGGFSLWFHASRGPVGAGFGDRLVSVRRSRSLVLRVGFNQGIFHVHRRLRLLLFDGRIAFLLLSCF